MPEVEVEVADVDRLAVEEIAGLYEAVGWTAYTDDIDALVQGIRRSLRVVVARRGSTLIGLARVIGDGATVCYLQDVLVHPQARRAGLGRALVAAAFAPFAHVRQHVLITDEEAEQKAFYEALGFTQLGAGVPGRAFVRFTNA